jgi:hypothetical protein
MNNKKINFKKGLLAVVASATPVAMSANILDDALVNITPAGSWTELDSEGNTISTNYYTGGVYFRFNPAQTRPIFVISPPSIEAGCNGINIKGMFMSLLGLGQLKEMITRAPSTLAMGAVVGIVYSLPGVASAFKMVNQWAKDLQNLLGNSCQSGIALGKAFADKALGMEAMGKKINAKLNEILPECQQDGENCAAAAIGLGEYFTKQGVFKYGGEDEEMSDQDKLDTLNSLFRGIFEADMSIGGKVVQQLSKIGGASGNFTKMIAPGSDPSVMTDPKKPYEDKSFYVTGSSLDTSVESNVVALSIEDLKGAFADGTVRTRAEQTLLGYALLYNFVGDIMITSTKKVIGAALKNYISSGSEKDGKVALSEFEHLSNFGVKIALAGPGAVGSAKSNGRALASYILYGNKVAVSKRLRSPQFYSIKMKNENSLGASTIVVAATPSDGKGATFSIENFNGVIAASRCQIKEKVLGEAAGPSCANTATVGIFVPNIDWYIKVIQDSPAISRNKLIDKLVEYNSAVAGRALISGLNASLELTDGFHKGFVDYKNDSASGDLSEANAQGASASNLQDGASIQLKLVQKASEVTHYALKSITETTQGTNSRKLELDFVEQNKLNKERGLKSARK